VHGDACLGFERDVRLRGQVIVAGIRAIGDPDAPRCATGDREREAAVSAGNDPTASV
jgi:hypothetical protein